MGSLGLSGEFWRERRELLRSAEIVLDLGSGVPFSGPVGSDDLNPECLYVSVDICFDHSPHVTGDTIVLPFADGVAGILLSNAVLEHVPEPQRAVDEMRRILKNGGYVLGYAPFMYPFHGSPSDYYRYTGKGLEHLFREFAEFSVAPFGNYSTAALGFTTGFCMPLVRVLGPFAHVLGSTLTYVVQIIGGRGRSRRSSYEQSPPGHYFMARK